MTSLKLNRILLFVVLMSIPLFAQKFAYVHSQKILDEFQEYKDALNKLEEIRNQYDAEYQQMLNEYNVLIEEIDSQSLLLSPEKKEEKMQNAQEKAMAIERYKYEKLGPEGEFYQRNLELTKPIIDKINELIQRIGKDEGYDFIFDASSGALLHADTDKYDITDRVLEELNKGVSTNTQGN